MRGVDDVDQTAVAEAGVRYGRDHPDERLRFGDAAGSMTIASIRALGRTGGEVNASARPSASTVQHMHPLLRLTAPSAWAETSSASMLTDPKSLTSTPSLVPPAPALRSR